MDTLDLKNFIVKIPAMRKNFKGVFTTDELVKLKGNKDQKPAIIIYTDKFKTDNIGHWVCVFLGEIPEFYDPLGHDPSYYSENIYNFLLQNDDKYIYSSHITQGNESINCGLFVLYFLFFRCHNIPYQSIVDSFSTNYEKNDNIVERLYYSFI